MADVQVVQYVLRHGRTSAIATAAVLAKFTLRSFCQGPAGAAHFAAEHVFLQALDLNAGAGDCSSTAGRQTLKTTAQHCCIGLLLRVVCS